MSSLPLLNALRAFDAVARPNSVSTAASELAVTPSAVSRRIGNLKEDGRSPPDPRRGKGAMISCTSLAHDEFASGRFVHPVDEAVAANRGYWLLTPRGERHRPNVAGFRSRLLREIDASFGRGGRRSW